MSTSRALCCLPLVKKQFFQVQCIIKQLLDSVFVISRIMEVSPTSSSIILDITKTSSNNCLLARLAASSTLKYVRAKGGGRCGCGGGGVVALNTNPSLKVNRGNNCSSIKMLSTA